MTQATDALESPHPFSLLVRASDRDALIVGIVESVWREALGLPLAVRPRSDAADDGEVQLKGTVQIRGEWNGRVMIYAPLGLAAECAARMLGTAVTALAPNEIGDAWGELANMVGGNLKSMVASPSRLSLPEVSDIEPGGHEERARALNEVTFACLGQRMRVVVEQA